MEALLDVRTWLVVLSTMLSRLIYALYGFLLLNPHSQCTQWRN
jgi:hypothetical protein